MRVCYLCAGKGTLEGRMCAPCQGKGIAYCVPTLAAADEIYEAAKLAHRYLRARPPPAGEGDLALRRHKRVLAGLGAALALAREPARSIPKAPRPRKDKTPAMVAVKLDDPTLEPLVELTFGLVHHLDQGSGAPWEDVVASAAREGLTEADVEVAIDWLMDHDLIIEPVLGRLKVAG